MSIEDRDYCDPQEEPEDFEIYNRGPMIRCKCGELVLISMPAICKCGDHKSYWQTLDGKILKLKDMDLGHLSNTVRMLGAKAEKYPQGDFRSKIEVALDLLYLEIGSREIETRQLTGIQKALSRALESTKPCES